MENVENPKGDYYSRSDKRKENLLIFILTAFYAVFLLCSLVNILKYRYVDSFRLVFKYLSANRESL